MSSEKNYINDNYKSFFEDSLSKKDPDLHKAIQDELLRQQQHIELIASENIVSQAVNSICCCCLLAHHLWLYVILDQLQISCLQKSFYNFHLNSFFH